MSELIWTTQDRYFNVKSYWRQPTCHFHFVPSRQQLHSTDLVFILISYTEINITVPSFACNLHQDKYKTGPLFAMDLGREDSSGTLGKLRKKSKTNLKEEECNIEILLPAEAEILIPQIEIQGRQ